MKSVASALVVAALVSTAHADDLVDDPLAKDATIATALTVTGIALPVAAIANVSLGGVGGDGYFMLGMLGMVALVPGPSIGHWYAGRSGGAGMGLRLTGFIIGAAGYSMFDDAKRCARGEIVTDGCEGASKNLGRAMMISGAWMVVGSWAYDLIESRRAVRRYNERRRAQLLPFFGSASAGVVLGGDF